MNRGSVARESATDDKDATEEVEQIKTITVFRQGLAEPAAEPSVARLDLDRDRRQFTMR